jgi:hypothetical protein
MKVVFAARRLNPGQYEAFRKAWEPPQGFPEGFARAYIIHQQEGSATGVHTIVPLTERVLPSGALGAYMDAAAMAGRMPSELVQLGIFRADDPAGMRESNQGGRQQMLDAIAPHVESTGIDSTFQMVEELTPAHA